MDTKTALLNERLLPQCFIAGVDSNHIEQGGFTLYRDTPETDEKNIPDYNEIKDIVEANGILGHRVLTWSSLVQKISSQTSETYEDVASLVFNSVTAFSKSGLI